MCFLGPRYVLTALVVWADTSQPWRRWWSSLCCTQRFLRGSGSSHPGKRCANWDKGLYLKMSYFACFKLNFKSLFSFAFNFRFCLISPLLLPHAFVGLHRRLNPNSFGIFAVFFRGCLFYGPPGTGKTLVARALANECSQGDRKVSFFMRKGADCLSKWVGESERQLRLLFDQVNQAHHHPA